MNRRTRCKARYGSKAAVMVSTGNTTPPKSTKLRDSDSLVSHCTDLKYKFGPISIWTERSRFFDVVDFGGVVLSGGSVTYPTDNTTCYI